ncbi:HelD family protein [Pseudactinotalea sp. Z1748]|uniref:HelD family protein n=1 Tax=Pseudactinotalea sp. Z1748 TaxID=3413027 RepID=UPI003C7B89BE
MTSPEVGPRNALEVEQSYVDLVYARLDELRAGARKRLAKIRREGPSGSPQNRSERDAFATMYEDRVSALDAVEDRLVFGRLDLRDGDRRYVGRIGVSDAEHSPVLTDWRAPAARAFYQATAHAPGEVTLRRHLQTRHRQVVAIEDDVLDLDALDPDTQVELAGEGALMAALKASRTGRMGDIVATIQAEQDAIIRSDLGGVLVVQGGPGTGKTAVALHRAAYLLYSHRERLERSGVLLIGPSRVFLRYIEQVLPALGETGVVSSTLGDLIPGISATAIEEPRVARIKGRRAWAGIISRAVRAKQRVLGPQELKVGSVVLQLRPDEVREAQARARRSGHPHNRARVTFVRAMLTSLATQYLEQIGGAGEEPAEVVEEIRSARDVRVALNLCWLPLTATGLVAELFAKPHKLEAVAGRMPAADREVLVRPVGSEWTTADIPLIDEAAELIGSDDETERAQARMEAARREQEVAYAREVLASVGSSDDPVAARDLVSAETFAGRFAEAGPRLTTAERAYRDRSWTYGHVVVDEAQELSEMAWRALLRRCPSRSMTVVGDVAQTSSPAGTREWSQRLDTMLRRDWRVAELTVNYRTPAAVMRAARAAVTAADPKHPPAPLQSAREVPDALVLTAANSLGETVAAVLEDEVAAVGEGTVAVITAAARQDELSRVLDIPAGPVDLTAQVVLLDPSGAKGLEFDRVIVAEPGAILAEGEPADLYVAMTRPTQRLHVVHAEELPPGFAAAMDQPMSDR